MRHHLLGSILLLAGLLAGCQTTGLDDSAAVVTLAKRPGSGGPYGASAYSFQHATGDLTGHRNYVDLVYQNCGLLHVDNYGGQRNRIADVGTEPLRDTSVSPGTVWRSSSIRPVAGHFYIEEVENDTHRMVVQFEILDVNAEELRLRWVPINGASLPPFPPGGGACGHSGFCGGPHSER